MSYYSYPPSEAEKNRGYPNQMANPILGSNPQGVLGYSQQSVPPGAAGLQGSLGGYSSTLPQGYGSQMTPSLYPPNTSYAALTPSQQYQQSMYQQSMYQQAMAAQVQSNSAAAAAVAAYRSGAQPGMRVPATSASYMGAPTAPPVSSNSMYGAYSLGTPVFAANPSVPGYPSGAVPMSYQQAQAHLGHSSVYPGGYPSTRPAP